jgi:hypothetical protein
MGHKTYIHEVAMGSNTDVHEVPGGGKNTTNLQLEYCVSFPDGENMIRPISMSHNTDSSYAFLINPLRRLEYVTCLLVGFSIFLISNFTLPILAS